ncbi:DNA-binding transcriptional MerR regulator [Isoptericola jiangsuensis]|uniref:DNA-binding transcriptional MerR regulator n=1 Tax=Isoptericola jiangsuensis TaxID=548579 RepID=A0A2A9ETT4_9MICO|nr:TipAS antibiotic-recognition domain-containing protein [Isoptericola jiangsuensis]PFG41645.1 DNA-binding transcriptional MerR regulator [Isoptericola jiangsuensis]
MSRSIQDVARLAGVSSRTLRHYDQIGLLPPSGTGPAGLRHYDDVAVRRLQRILLLRDLGLPLAEIGDVLDAQTDEAAALRGHLAALHDERRRLDRQIASVGRTLTALEKGRPIMAEEMLDGFDHTQHEQEVTERWGADAYRQGDAWWRGLGPEGQADWKARTAELSRAWTDAAARGVDPASDEAQELAARHAAWLGSVPGTPGSDVGRPPRAYVVGLAEMYVADERFAANYGGVAGATFVRDALVAYAEREL